MRIKPTREEFEKIENSFDVLIENSTVTSAVESIEESLHTCFPDYTFELNVITAPDVNFFMSVYPEMSTTNKIVDGILGNKENKVINDLWKNNKKWTVEIDSKVLNGRYTKKELTAMLMHEIGHIALSEYIPTKAAIIIKYKLMTGKMAIRSAARASVFRPVLSLPILDACVIDKKKTTSSIKDEIKADKFASKFGYKEELSSALKKVIEDYKLNSTKHLTLDESIEKSMGIPNDTINDIVLRRNNLAKDRLRLGKEWSSTRSPYMEAAFEAAFIALEGNEGASSYGPRMEATINEQITESQMSYMADMISDNKAEYTTEFFHIIAKKRLPRIPREEIDYIRIKIKDIHNQNDVLMLVTYLYSKLEKVEYYMTILENPDKNKGLIVPYSMAELKDLKDELFHLRDEILSYKIPMRDKNILVSWPTGYEG